MSPRLKQLIEEMGGTVLLDGALIQFGEESFERMYISLYEAGMSQAARICQEYGEFKNSDDVRNCVALVLHHMEQPDMRSVSSGESRGQH